MQPIVLFLLSVFIIGQPQQSSHDDGATGAYLNVSFEAQEELAKAEGEAEDGRWSAAASRLQAIARQYGDYLIPIEQNSDRYVSIRSRVNHRIAAWPAKGVEAYRSLFEESAAAGLAEATIELEIAPLIDVANDYFATEAGASALAAAAELAIEQGMLRSAFQWYTYLLAYHPQADRLRPDWQIRRAACALWESDAAPINELAAQYSEIDPGPTVVWRGRKQSAFDVVRSIQSEGATANETTPGDKGPVHGDRSAGNKAIMYYGSVQRQGLFSTTAFPEARLWQFIAADARDESGDDESRRASREAMHRSIQTGRLLSNEPVSAGERLYWNDGRSVWALDPNSPERAAWRYEFPQPASASPGWINEDEPPEQHTILVHGDCVFAPLNSESNQRSGDSKREIASIICLDAKSGVLLWQKRLDELGSRFEHILLDGAPVLHNGRLFATARRRKAFGFEACLLICLDPGSGQLLWKTHVGEAPTGSYGYYRPTRAHLAAAGDLVVVSTNLGTVAAVAATTGRVAWLSCYRSQYSDPSQVVWPTRFGRPIRAWHYQPAMIWRESVICAPLDSDELFVFDQFDGRMNRRVRLDRLSHPETIIGIAADFLYCVGGQVVCYDLSSDRIAWQRPLSEGQLFGRGALSTNGLFIPTDQALLRYPLDGGPAESFSWSLQDAGNVVPLADQIVIATSDGLFALAGRADAYLRLSKRMRERPSDHLAALALADLAFETKEFEKGLEAARAAVKRFEDSQERETAASRRIFDRLIEFAGRTGGPGPYTATSSPQQNVSREVTEQLLELALRCAPRARDRIVALLLLANLCLAHHAPHAAVEAYQTILEDESLRERRLIPPKDCIPAVGRDDDGMESASRVGYMVARWIGRLVAEHGAGVYEPVDSEARKRLEAVRDKPELEVLSELIESYPNSSAAIDARLMVARVASDEGGEAIALHAYRRFLDHRGHPQRPAVLREFVERLLELNRRAEAAAWLERAMREHPAYRFQHEGRELSFESLREMLFGTAIVGSCGPRLELPLTKSVEQLFSDRVAILTPMNGGPFPSAWEGLVVFADSRLDVRTAATGKGKWASAFPMEDQPVLLGADERLLFLATGHRLLALRQSDGGLAWQFGERPPEDADVDPESHAAWNGFALTKSLLVASSDRGELVCLDIEDGNLRWRQDVDGMAGQMTASPRFVCLTAWKGRDAMIIILDAESGRLVREVSVEGNRPIQSLTFSPDGLLLGVRSRSILALRPATGESAWRIDSTRHFSHSTIHMDEDGLFASTDGRGITKYDWFSGDPLWKTRDIASEARGGPWVQPAGGRMLVASGAVMSAFDTADGRLLWSVDGAFDLKAHPPVLTESVVIGLSPYVPEAASDSDTAETGPPPLSSRFVVRGIRVADGSAVELAEEGPLITDSLQSFGGMHVQDGALILLDGNRLISYCAQ